MNVEVTDLAAGVRAMPKLEMHIHLEGSISHERIVEMAAAANVALPRPVDELYLTHDISVFLSNLDWVCSIVRSADTAEALALDFARYARTQGIVYAEVIVNPTHWGGMHLEDLFGALASGFDKAADAGLPDIRLLPSILRQQSAEEAMHLVEWMGKSGIRRICGLSVDGNQAKAPGSSERFAPAYARARELGFGCTAHAGESSGPEGVAEALDWLGVSRIDHGVRAVEQPALVERLVDQRITLNICLSSNCALLYGDVSRHPFLQLVDAGVACTLNTDDPVVLKTTLCRELAWAGSELDWGLPELICCQRNAIASAFCSDEEKARLNAGLDAFAAAV